MVVNYETLDFYVGGIIRDCQIIEHDIKMIYSRVHSSNWRKMFELIEKNTLGEVVRFLEDADSNLDRPFFNKEDYRLLKSITKTRNYWAHNGYIDCVYDDQGAVDDQTKYARFDHKWLDDLAHRIENIRIRLFD